ncbi:polysaccharide deacetylase family protein [Paenibacillus sp. MBLB4367]|uniref:polysaccharide deacetylase family protein n=1 Tax=Paenibacillus sp. MBLB4367 TaxID=3384767 RepID=UPI0039082E85
MNRLTLAAVVSLALFTASCQNGADVPSSSGQDAVSSPSASATPAAPSPTAAVSAQPSASASATPMPEPAKPAEQTIAKTYRMNKNYDIVPIDPNVSNKKVVLLTFDDGPKEKGMIDGLIDTLDKHKAKAIFFVNGYRVKQHPELLKLIHDRGQIIGNHSWDHIDLKKESNASIDKQLGDVQTIVKDTLGFAPQFFRPPFGSSNEYVKEKAKAEHMLFMTWSNGSLDWEEKETKKTPELVIQKVLDQLHAGSNILMHELPWTVQALDGLLTELEEKGYGFVDPRAIEIE